MFSTRKDSKDGYRNTCKECTKKSLNIIPKPPDSIVVCAICHIATKSYSQFTKKTKKCKNCKNKIEKMKNDLDRDKYNKRMSIWREKNKECINSRKRELEKKKRDKDPTYRLRHNMSTRLYLAVKKKYGNTFELVGCSKEDLCSYLESKFLEGMNWKNYGQWHVDHIIPCASFNLDDPEQQKACFHWSNLQPLWGIDNMKKGAKIQ